MTPTHVRPGVIALALGWLLGPPAPASSPSAPVLDALLRPGQSVTLGGLTVTAPPQWRGLTGAVTQTRLSLQRLNRADLDVPPERGQRLAGPIYVLKATPAVFQDARQSFSVSVPLPGERPAGQVVPAMITALQVDAAPPHPGGSVRVWVVPEWTPAPGAATFTVSGLDEGGLVWTTFLLGAS